jgi:hypothetical protein
MLNINHENRIKKELLSSHENNQLINYRPENMTIEQIYYHHKNMGSSNPVKDTLNIIKSTKENNKLNDINIPINLKDDISFEQTNQLKGTLNKNIKSKSKRKNKSDKSETDYESDFKRNYPSQYRYYQEHKDEISIKSSASYQRKKEGKKIINQNTALLVEELNKQKEENEKIMSDRNEMIFEDAKRYRERKIVRDKHENVVKELKKNTK